LYRSVFPAILAIAFAAHAAPAESGQLDASPTLFTVMAAINLCGYDADLDSPNNHPVRQAIRNELSKRNLSSLGALKEFYARHRAHNDTDELSQYISFALTAGPPPTFAIKMRDVEIPPDVSGMTELPGLLAAFYKEANIEELWKRSQPAIDQYINRYHTGVSEAVLQSNVYLRQQTSGFKGVRFQIFLELQGAPNQVQTRSYGNEFTIVITPSPTPRIFEVRHAYLTYLLDPLATRNQEVLARKKYIMDHAQRARLLPDQYKNDFLLMTTASLVKAVEARLDKQPQKVGQALSEGFILAPYFFEQLPAFEAQEQAMLLYYKELVSSIDLGKEDARLGKVTFSSEPPARPVRAPSEPVPVALTGVAKTLDDAEKLYRANQFEESKKLFLAALQETDLQSQHAAAYYGLGRIAVRQNDPETGERLLNKALEMQPEPWIRAWTLVFLGRLSLAAGEKEQALQQFRSALILEGASDEARKQAQLGIDQSSKQ
jgi:tetratricopeptide (TPR) repeat protein